MTESRVSLQRQYEIHRSNLNKLEEQKAQHGLDAPLHLLNNIEYEKRELKRIEALLEAEIGERGERKQSISPSTMKRWKIPEDAKHRLIAKLAEVFGSTEEMRFLAKRVTNVGLLQFCGRPLIDWQNLVDHLESIGGGKLQKLIDEIIEVHPALKGTLGEIVEFQTLERGDQV